MKADEFAWKMIRRQEYARTRPSDQPWIQTSKHKYRNCNTFIFKYLVAMIHGYYFKFTWQKHWSLKFFFFLFFFFVLNILDWAMIPGLTLPLRGLRRIAFNIVLCSSLSCVTISCQRFWQHVRWWNYLCSRWLSVCELLKIV